MLGKCSWAFSGKSTWTTRLHQNFGAANQSLSTNLSTWTPISISNDLKNRCESYTKMVPSMPPAPHCGCDQGTPPQGWWVPSLHPKAGECHHPPPPGILLGEIPGPTRGGQIPHAPQAIRVQGEFAEPLHLEKITGEQFEGEKKPQ